MTTKWISRASSVACVIVLLSAAVPYDAGPQKIRVGPDLFVTKAEFGWVHSATGDIVPASTIDTAKNPSFAWRLEFEGRPREISFREEFDLPAPAQVWQVGPNTTVAPDRASAVTMGKVELTHETMSARNGWVHTVGDPKGAHIIRVAVDGVPVRDFHFVLR